MRSTPTVVAILSLGVRAVEPLDRDQRIELRDDNDLEVLKRDQGVSASFIGKVLEARPPGRSLDARLTSIEAGPSLTVGLLTRGAITAFDACAHGTTQTPSRAS